MALELKMKMKKKLKNKNEKKIENNLQTVFLLNQVLIESSQQRFHRDRPNLSNVLQVNVELTFV